jgi:hypothetical protein
MHYADYVRSLRQARKARRRGDVAAADHWSRIAERHMRMAERLIGPTAPIGGAFGAYPEAVEEEKARVRQKLTELIERMEKEKAEAQAVPQDA